MQENRYFFTKTGLGLRKDTIDVTMGSVDVVKICELVALLLLNKLSSFIWRENRRTVER